MPAAFVDGDNVVSIAHQIHKSLQGIIFSRGPVQIPPHAHGGPIFRLVIGHHCRFVGSLLFFTIRFGGAQLESVT